LGTVKGLKFALRAELVLAQYIYKPEARLASIEKGLEDADKAMEMAPNDVEIIISTGILVGLRGRYNQSISDAKEAARLFEKAIEIDPNQSWALGALGSWHAETIAEAGVIAGHLILGAKKKLAWEYFDRAIGVEPENLAIRAAHVRALFKIKRKKNTEEIKKNIAYILSQPAKNALEKILKEQIRQIDAAWKAGDEKTLKLLLDEVVSLESALKK